MAPGLCGEWDPVLQAKPHALSNAALQGNGSLECLPEQTQQPLQSILESSPGVVGGTVQCQWRPAPPDPHASGDQGTLLEATSNLPALGKCPK